MSVKLYIFIIIICILCGLFEIYFSFQPLDISGKISPSQFDWNFYGAIYIPPYWIIIALNCIYFLSLLALCFYWKAGRLALVLYIMIDTLATIFLGAEVIFPRDAFLSNISLLLNGVILGEVFFGKNSLKFSYS